MESAEWSRMQAIGNSWIPVVGGNPPPWVAEALVAPEVILESSGSTIRAFVPEQERIPYRVARVEDAEVRGRVAQLTPEDLGAIRWAMGQLLATWGPRSDSARDIAEVKQRVGRALVRLTETGAAANLRRALLGSEGKSETVILRLYDERDNVKFIVLMKGDQVLAGANEVEAMYYAALDMREGRIRPHVESEEALDLLDRTWHGDDWTNLLYSLAQPVDALPEEKREAMDTWCREPLGVRKPPTSR
jgi:hypothetical protein